VDTLYTVRFGEVSGLSSFKHFKKQTTGCGDIAYSAVGYFILSHPVDAKPPTKSGGPTPISLVPTRMVYTALATVGDFTF